MSHLRAFSKLSVAGFIATVVDGVVYAVLGLFAPETAFATGLIAALAAIVGGVTNFLLCKFWVFRSENGWKGEAGRYVIASGSGALIHGTLVGGLSLVMSSSAAWFVSKAIVYVVWTYPTSTWFVFRKKSEAVS